ncbi:hypothetical protein IMCC20628_01845 [Hoeflea sp. IMCC20628]|uniref:hypothetical protein n=1 Tax=Hoeflea sp. IMCC20628 TaxID=1620421 RepID=UPI00063AF5F2|nr:hypothetical protein [Hoeflea sp. IMCC20628]AKI00552.1 hypothetical protein IMCC20628_01845 [Hoeflea sp. IMCC20628]
MSRRTFSKVSPSVWQSARFRALSEGERLVYLYYITCSHVDSAGCFHLPDLYACADLDLSPEEYEPMREALIAAGLIDYDTATSFVRIARWFKHNPPMNPKHAQGTRIRIEAIPSERLRMDCLAEFEPVEHGIIEKAEETAARKEMDKFKTGQTFGSGALLYTRFMSGAGR